MHPFYLLKFFFSLLLVLWFILTQGSDVILRRRIPKAQAFTTPHTYHTGTELIPLF